jgi:hypothetical protein
MKARKYRSSSEYPVSVYINGRPDPVRVQPDETYETADRAEIEALNGSPEVREIKDKK